MKYIVLLSSLFILGQAFSQKIANPEKFAKGVFESLKEEDRKSFMKLTLTEKQYDNMLAQTDIEEGDKLAYSEITESYDSMFTQLLLDLHRDGIEPAAMEFQKLHYSIYKGEHEMTGSFHIYFTDGKQKDSYQVVLNDCIHFDGRWVLGSRVELKTYRIDLDLLCRCLNGELNIEAPQCVELMQKGEEAFNALSPEEQEQVQAVIEECFAIESMEVEGEEASEEEATEPNIITTYMNQLESAVPGACDCAGGVFNEESITPECEQTVNDINNFLLDPELSIQDNELYLEVLRICARR